MTKRVVFRSILGIAAAALLTLSLGACVSREKAMKEGSDSSMQKSTMTDDKAMSGDSSMSSNSTMKSDTTMSSGSTMAK